MNMYQSGELDQVMANFERTLKDAPIYVGAAPERAEKVEVQTEGGRISMRYRNNQYYNHGQINALFLMFLHGYAAGKAA